MPLVSSNLKRCVAALAVLGAGAVPFALSTSPATAWVTPPPGITVPPGFSIAQFAAGSGALNNPDDIAELDGNVYVAYQNGVSATGGAGPGGITHSTIVEYSPDGEQLDEWTATGRVDGIAADPANHVLYATANEDANSTFYIVDPYAPTASQLRQLTYNDPTGAITGGTDAVSVDPFGNVYI